MRFYTKQHRFYCGIDLHARTMYVCIVNHDGEILVHRNMPAGPAPFLKAMAPYRGDLVVCVEWTLHLGPGSPTSATVKAFRLSLDMPGI